MSQNCERSFDSERATAVTASCTSATSRRSQRSREIAPQKRMVLQPSGTRPRLRRLLPLRLTILRAPRRTTHCSGSQPPLPASRNKGPTGSALHTEGAALPANCLIALFASACVGRVLAPRDDRNFDLQPYTARLLAVETQLASLDRCTHTGQSYARHTSGDRMHRVANHAGQRDGHSNSVPPLFLIGARNRDVTSGHKLPRVGRPTSSIHSSGPNV